MAASANRVYRILRRPFAKQPLNGEGAFRYGGRWSSPGIRLTYTSEHLSLAMLEYLVHIDVDDPPPDLVVISADIPASVSRIRLAPHDLPASWRDTPAPSSLAGIGDEFVRAKRAAVLVVPSALAPSETNWLINPLHKDSHRIRLLATESFGYDRRFFI